MAQLHECGKRTLAPGSPSVYIFKFFWLQSVSIYLKFVRGLILDEAFSLHVHTHTHSQIATVWIHVLAPLW